MSWWRKVEIADCYSCGRKKARPHSYFCSQRCAAEWADEIAGGNEVAWCPTCKNWVGYGPELDVHEHPLKVVTLL